VKTSFRRDSAFRFHFVTQEEIMKNYCKIEKVLSVAVQLRNSVEEVCKTQTCLNVICQENQNNISKSSAVLTHNGEQEGHNGSEKPGQCHFVSVSELLSVLQSNGLRVHVAVVLAVVAKLEVASKFLHHRYCLPN